MRFKVLVLSLLTLISLSPVSAQSVENVVAEVGSNGKVIITYDLKGDPEKERFSTSIYSSHNGYSQPLVNVTGDIDTEYNVIPGSGKRVEWDAASELGSYNGELAFEIRARVYQFLRVTRPAAGKWVRRGSTTAITWAGGQSSEKINIQLLKGERIVSNLSTVNNSGSYSWSIPKDIEKGKDYKLRLTGSKGPITTEPFSINAKYPLLLKVAVPAALIAGTIVLIGGGSDDGPLPVPPEPN